MKQSLFLVATVVLTSVSVFAQKPTSFPGVSAAQLKQLQIAKRFTALPLPTWIPAGFKLEKVESRLGPRVKIEDRSLVIVYSKQLPGGKIQRFAFEAGFDGLGDLMYDGAKRLSTPLGPIYLVYQPNDEDGKKLLDFAMTEWFDVGRTAFHYIGTFGEDGDPAMVMISRQETKRIIRSLKRF